jgi:hypothetical protein
LVTEEERPKAVSFRSRSRAASDEFIYDTIERSVCF